MVLIISAWKWNLIYRVTLTDIQQRQHLTRPCRLSGRLLGIWGLSRENSEDIFAVKKKNNPGRPSETEQQER